MNQSSTQKPENPWINLLVNVVIPTLILMKGSKEEYLGPTLGLIVALSFPLAYGLFDFYRTRKVNMFSVLGIVSVLLTGGMSLLKFPPEYIAIKEAAVPGLIGIFCLVSIYTPYPLIRTVLYNDKVLQLEKVQRALHESNNLQAFEVVLKKSTYFLAGSFFLSSALNYILAKVVLVSPPGTEAYNEELGKMMGLSFPVIALPSMLVMVAALYYLFNNITRLTQLQWEDILNQPNPKTKEHN